MFLGESPRISDSELKVDNDENDTKPKNSKVKTSSCFEPCEWRTCPRIPDVFISLTTADFLLRNEACEIVKREYPSEWEINSTFFEKNI